MEGIKEKVLKPLDGKVLIRVHEEKRKDGLVLVSKKHDDEKEVLVVEVLEVGEGVVGFGVGDKVLIRGYSGHWIGSEVVDSTITHRVIDASEVMAVVSSVKKS